MKLRERPAIDLVLAGLVLIYAVVLLRTAFVCDDAFITFRTVDNFAQGYGLRWNVSERVQTFTNPLWTLVLSAMFRITGDLYYTSLVLSIGLSVGTATLLAGPMAGDRRAGVLALTLLLLSKAFVDFSTSGLENALSHALLVGFFFVALRDDKRPPSVLLVSALAALAMLNRLDNLLLVGPTLAALTVKRGTRKTWAELVLGLSPVALWGVFSVVYYGFPFPNTAYAKVINTGVPRLELAGQGLHYLVDSLRIDPLTLCVIAAALGLAGWTRRRELLFPAVGLTLSLLYVVRVGGDFMSGRFLSGPFVVAVIVLARFDWSRITFRPLWAGALALAWTLGLLAPSPTIFSGADYGGESVPAHGIADIRWRQYPKTGLLHVLRRGRFDAIDALEGVSAGKRLRDAGTRVALRGGVGYAGFYAGPAVHIVDKFALTDPFLARLPAARPWSIAHFRRELPAGYLESVSSGRNALTDPELSRLYAQIESVTRGPLFTAERWRAIVALNRIDLLGPPRLAGSDPGTPAR